MSKKSRAPYLSHARIDQFGSLGNRTVGPFESGLNIVFGPNESGKSTLAAFVGGVLFGWEEARGSRNTYKPVGAERAGSLIFAQEEGDELLELRRVRNADGLQGATQLVDDLDKDTFRTMFSLTSDELRSLHGTADVTARLLTAGAGTGSSPAQALTAVRERLARYTSRAAGATESITLLVRERAAARSQMADAAAEAERFRDQDRELCELTVRRQKLNAQVGEANAAAERLSSCRAALEKLDAETETLRNEAAQLSDVERRAVANRRTLEGRVGRKLARISSAEDRAMRDKLDELADRELKAAHALEAAQSDFNASNALYETILETQDDARMPGRSRVRRAMQIVVPVALCVLLVLLGVPVFVQGRDAGSLSYASLGLVMIAFGLLLAAAALVLLFRPTRSEEERAERLQDAQMVMLQDKKKLEACQEASRALGAEIAADLDEMGMAAAEGSLRKARALLDEAREVRAEMAVDQQKQQNASARLAQIEARLDEAAAQRAHLCERAGLDAEATLDDVDAAASRCASARAELLEEAEAAHRRYGELKQILAQATQSHEFDHLKMRVHELTSRIEDSTRDVVRLLLAKRLLESAIGAWESKSQPEVYAQAGRLLSLMTDGRWTRVMLSDDGELQVLDSAMTLREPRLLSLGTCQQLYLALRIALLMCAENVGRSVPVLADDILVNFDAARRAGAARALVELSERRQVILLTCHEEVVTVLKRAAEEAGRPANTVVL